MLKNKSLIVFFTSVFLSMPVYSFDNTSINIEMVKVTGGTFKMGSDDGGSDEKPIHKVKVSDYEMSAHEITKGLFSLVMNEKFLEKNENPPFYNDKNQPIENISWWRAKDFCNSYNNLKGLPNAYDKDGKIINWTSYRLPTEAEWEYAAKGGNKSKGYKYAGSNELDEIAVYENNSAYMDPAGSDYGPHIVTSKKPNELGLYDMSGNVWEWCSDWYDEDFYNKYSVPNPYNYTKAISNTSFGYRGYYKVMRGGSWFDGSYNLRTTTRRPYHPDSWLGQIGFRLARSLPSK